MLQETVYQKKSVGLLKKGFYHLRTAKAVWSRVQVVERSHQYVRIFYTRRIRRKRQRIVQKLLISTILEAKRYYE
ncbi:hypothetical protein LCGC14_0612990 [marine sediment metagenome]|uniref:Uncharacterized protein n=1 Tax=marine sediment metagenome TaxID=412755 RepID=A0A0F9RRD6_9ZZZZ